MNFKILRQQVTSRGGGVEIDLSEFGEGCRMAAYQNYLGGGMLGRVCSNVNWDVKEEDEDRVEEIAEELKRYYWELTSPDEDEWEYISYEQNQNMPVSGY